MMGFVENTAEQWKGMCDDVYIIQASKGVE